MTNTQTVTTTGPRPAPIAAPSRPRFAKQTPPLCRQTPFLPNKLHGQRTATRGEKAATQRATWRVGILHSKPSAACLSASHPVTQSHAPLRRTPFLQNKHHGQRTATRGEKGCDPACDLARRHFSQQTRWPTPQRHTESHRITRGAAQRPFPANSSLAPRIPNHVRLLCTISRPGSGAVTS